MRIYFCKADLFEIITGQPWDIASKDVNPKTHNKMKKYKTLHFCKDLLKSCYLNYEKKLFHFLESFFNKISNFFKIIFV